LDQVPEFLKSLSLTFKDKVIIKEQNLRNDLLITAKWYGQHAYLKDVCKNISKEDLAAGVQYFAEKVSVEFLKRHLRKEKLPVVLAGGVFANGNKKHILWPQN
jgi:predicted NodU family carbamoyl transferase